MLFCMFLSHLHLSQVCVYITSPQAEKVHKRLPKINFKISYCRKHSKNCPVFFIKHIKIPLYAHRNIHSSNALYTYLYLMTLYLRVQEHEYKKIRGYIFMNPSCVSFFFFLLYFCEGLGRFSREADICNNALRVK